MEDLFKLISKSINAILNPLAVEITDRHYELQPEYNRYGKEGYDKGVEDAHYHLTYLAEAINNNSPILFREYVRWADTLFNNLKMPLKTMEINLEVIREITGRHFTGEVQEVINRFIEQGSVELRGGPREDFSYLEKPNPLRPLLENYYDALMKMDRHRASEIILDAAKSGTAIQDIYTNVLEVFLHEVGRMWQMNRLTVAQEHYCTAATQLIMSQLYPYIFNGVKNDRVMVSAAVSGELHEVGIRMVTDLLEMDGWDTYYLGANMPRKDIIKIIVEKNAGLVALSSTLMIHVHKIEECIRDIREHAGNHKIKILVGGNPFNVDNELWRKVGSDSSAANALEAVSLSRKMVSE